MSPVHEFVLCTITQKKTISGGGGVNKTQNIDCPLSRTVGKLLPYTRSGFHGTSVWLLKLSESQLPENLRCLPVSSSLGSYKVEMRKNAYGGVG